MNGSLRYTKISRVPTVMRKPKFENKKMRGKKEERVRTINLGRARVKIFKNMKGILQKNGRKGSNKGGNKIKHKPGMAVRTIPYAATIVRLLLKKITNKRKFFRKRRIRERKFKKVIPNKERILRT